MAIGHFKKQCTQIQNTCRTCGEHYADLKDHNCSHVDKCIHCQQNHKSNSLKCPVVKTFRAELTKKLLSLNNHSTPTTSNSNITPFIHNTTDFPFLPAQQATTVSPMMMKLDDLIIKMSEVKDHLANLTLKHDKFEQFMLEKNQKKGNPLDADLKCKLERYLIQMKKAKEGKHYFH
jgi:hypothetical protein